MRIEDRIKTGYNSFSKSQKKIADYIVEDRSDIVYIKASELAKKLSVSPSTIGRFAKAIGYGSYIEMQDDIRMLYSNSATSFDRYNLSKKSLSDDHRTKEIMLRDVDNIITSIESQDFSKIEDYGRMIKSAKSVYIIGFRSSKVLADYLGFYLNFILDNVNIVPSGVADALDEIIHIKKDDIAIVFSFPRYSKRTYELVKYVRSKGANIIGVTDSHLSPMNKYTDNTLYARFTNSTFIDSLVAPMSLVNAIILSVVKDENENISKNFAVLEELWNTYDIYEK